MTRPPSRLESLARLVILLAIGGMAGAAAFTHVHDLTVAHGQPDWIGWANAVAVELMAIYLGLDIRARRRTGRPVGLVGLFLVAFACLSLAAQVAEAEPTVWGWIVAAVPSLAFLSLVKVVLSSTPTRVPGSAPVPGASTGVAVVPASMSTVAEPVHDAVPDERLPASVPPAPARASSAVLPPLGIVHPSRINGQAVTR